MVVAKSIARNHCEVNIRSDKGLACFILYAKALVSAMRVEVMLFSHVLHQHSILFIGH